LADWLQQAGPRELADLQTLVEASAAPRSLPMQTLAQVADWFGLAHQTVKQWRSSGCPGEEGAYDLQAIARWRVSQGRQEQAGATSRKAALEQEQLELANARLKMRLRREAGELVSRAAAKSAIRQMFARLKSQLEPLSELLAPLLPNELRADFRRDCADRVRILLQQLANWWFERDVSGVSEAPEDEIGDENHAADGGTVDHVA